MLSIDELHQLLKKDESPILEFKREWYWDDSTDAIEMGSKWGEFIKDVISLSNGYLGHVGHFRHLIIGFSESDQNLYDVNIDKIKLLSNIKLFKKTLIEKLERYTLPSLLNIDVDVFNIDNKRLIVFEIMSPSYATELKQELITKTKTLDIGSIIIRKGQKSDEVRIATFKEMQELSEEFKIYRDSSTYKKMNQDNDKKNENERSIEKTVQLYIDKNSSYSLEYNFPIKVKNWKEDIIYEIYKLTDGLGSIKEFIYIHSSSNQGKTLGDIKKNKFVENLYRSVILTDRPRIKDAEKRKDNISQLFGTKLVYFVDEFGYQFLYKDCMLPYQKFNLKVCVNGLYDGDENNDIPAIDRLLNWFNSENEPLFIVSGHGGIGKTTLAKQFLDNVYDISKNSGILFIDSKEIIGELLRNIRSNTRIDDVYDFYKAQIALNDDECVNFTKDLLKLSIDNGSMVIVLDGIDEVIAKLGDKFDIDSFITSIFKDYSSDLNRTKILITCRDHFWNEVGKKILLPEITLKPFSEELAKEFFSQYFNGDTKKITKAMDVAESLALEESCKLNNSKIKVYIPFLLDMIGYLIKSREDDFNEYNSLSSSFLLDGNHTDFLIAKVCNREITKLESLGLDDQIKLFISMSTKRQNRISLYDIKEELSTILGKNIQDELVEKIKGHPLLSCSDNNIYFRYDVFNVYFKALYLVDFFRRKNIYDYDEKTKRIIIGYLKYDNSFTKTICERLKYDEDLIIFSIELIDKLISDSEDDYESLISAITSLLLNLMQYNNSSYSNISNRTDLLEKIFYSNNKMSGLCLVDIFGTTEVKPTFDFRNKILNNCTFSNYQYFWECQMNENTRFEASTFKNIDPRDGVKFKLYDNLFSSDCNISSIQHLLNIKEEEKSLSKKQLFDDLIKIFRLFYERGNFYPRKQAQVRTKVFAAKLLPVLINKNVIVNYKDPSKPTMQQFSIDDKYKSVINYIEQGSQSVELFQLIDELVE